MSSNEHRLRKYARKKRKSEWLTMLYWRYWHKVHGDHACLWSMD